MGFQFKCTKCGQARMAEEKRCSKCGAKFGGELWVLLLGLLMACALPCVIVLSGQSFTRRSFGVLLFGFILPVITGTAVCYDHNPKRRWCYFLIGSLISLTALSLWY